MYFLGSRCLLWNIVKNRWIGDYVKKIIISSFMEGILRAIILSFILDFYYSKFFAGNSEIVLVLAILLSCVYMVFTMLMCREKFVISGFFSIPSYIVTLFLLHHISINLDMSSVYMDPAPGDGFVLPIYFFTYFVVAIVTRCGLMAASLRVGMKES